MKNLIQLSLLSLFLLSACNSSPSGTTTSPTANPSTVSSPATGNKVDFIKVKAVITQRCSTCHATKATDTSFGSPAGNTALETDEQIKAKADRIKIRAVDQKTMPYANNKTGITDEERALLGKWVDSGAPIN